MQNVSVVIGANYGDEGKGQTVHDLTVGENTCVVRFNGSAQAGHTVTTEDGKVNIFHQHGSGSFKGAATYLSRHHLVHPFVYQVVEHDKFPNAPVFIDSRARIVLLTDMFLNRLIEEERSTNRHGSCGAGVNEAVVRQKTHPLLISDLFVHGLDDKLFDIRVEYAPGRLRQLGMGHLIPKFEEMMSMHEQILEHSNLLDMLDTTVVIDGFDEIAAKYDNVVFEGAQGLMLSETNMQWFPHLTRSDTGIHNVIDILAEVQYKGAVDVFYITRPYVTRHGAGPLLGEGPLSDLPFDVVDDTNIDNPYQGSIRYAPLNITLLAEQLYKDIDHSPPQFINHLLITCLDQCTRTIDIPVIIQGQRTLLNLEEVYNALEAELPDFKVVERGYVRDWL